MPRQDADKLAPVHIPFYDISIGSNADDIQLSSSIFST
jgi:hypothetical protein